MNEDDEIAVAEYVLGTLPADERARLALRMVGDPGLRAALGFWQARLAPLNATVLSAQPPPELWRGIKLAIDSQARDGAWPVAPGSSNVVELRRRLAWWRGGATAAAALAAGLAGMLVMDRSAVPPQVAPGRYIAIVDTGGREPALIADVDTSTGLIRIRAVAAKTPPGHSLELWHIADGQKPRSLGVLTAGAGGQTIPHAVSAGPVGGVIAVTIEAEGGSPSGAPTGQPVYSGRLIPVE